MIGVGDDRILNSIHWYKIDNSKSTFDLQYTQLVCMSGKPIEIEGPWWAYVRMSCFDLWTLLTLERSRKLLINTFNTKKVDFVAFQRLTQLRQRTIDSIDQLNFFRICQLHSTSGANNRLDRSTRSISGSTLFFKMRSNRRIRSDGDP